MELVIGCSDIIACWSTAESASESETSTRTPVEHFVELRESFNNGDVRRKRAFVAAKTLESMGVREWNDLKQISISDFRRARNFGETYYNFMSAECAKLGIHLPLWF